MERVTALERLCVPAERPLGPLTPTEGRIAFWCLLGAWTLSGIARSLDAVRPPACRTLPWAPAVDLSAFRE